MRRSFGGNQGMGGGGGGGSGMLRTVARAVTRAGVGGVQEPFSASTNTTTSTNTRPTTTTTTTTHRHKPNSSNLLSLSSSTSSPSPFSPLNLPISPTSSAPTWPSFSSSSSSYCDEFEWVSLDGSEDERANGFFDDFVLGPVPSMDEVQNAVSTLQQVFDPASYSQLIRDRYVATSDKDVAHHITTPTGLIHGASSFNTELDWIEPSLQLCNSRMLRPNGSDRVYDAFHLLQTEPSVQRMVISLSCDRAVWDAVLNNEVVRELRESVNADAAENNSLTSSDEVSDGSKAATSILKMIFDNTKAKAMELIEKITKLVNQLFHPPSEKTTEAATDPFEEKLRSSFLLTVVVLLIVAVARSHRG